MSETVSERCWRIVQRLVSLVETDRTTLGIETGKERQGTDSQGSTDPWAGVAAVWRTRQT